VPSSTGDLMSKDPTWLVAALVFFYALFPAILQVMVMMMMMMPDLLTPPVRGVSRLLSVAAHVATPADLVPHTGAVAL
jgi:hypothetical protein